jgi:hypothetical protein
MRESRKKRKSEERKRDDGRGGRSTYVAGAPREKGLFMRATVRWASKIITERERRGSLARGKKEAEGVRARATG